VVFLNQQDRSNDSEGQAGSPPYNPTKRNAIVGIVEQASSLLVAGIVEQASSLLVAGIVEQASSLLVAGIVEQASSLLVADLEATTQPIRSQ